MKKNIFGFLLLSLFLSQQTLYAAPERMIIKDSAKVAKENASRAALKNIAIGDIEDPTARKAIGEILNYLNLQSKK